MDLRAVKLVLPGVLLLLSACGGSKAPSANSANSASHIFAGGKVPPGDTAANPFAGNAGSVKEGEQLFASMNCDGCHGGGATGWVAPSLNDGRWRYGGSGAVIFQSI